jgi:hypothetical protein
MCITAAILIPLKKKCFLYKGIIKIKKRLHFGKTSVKKVAVVLSQSSEAKPDPTHGQKMGHIWLS